MESLNGRFSKCGLSQCSGWVAEGRLMPPGFWALVATGSIDGLSAELKTEEAGRRPALPVR